jgi:sensor domain CHASE-containing protein
MISIPFKDKPRLRSLLVAVILLAFLLPAWWWTSLKYRDRLLTEKRHQVSGNVAIHSQTLGSAIANRLALLKGLKAFMDRHLATQEGIAPVDFEAFAAAIHPGFSAIRSMAIAADGAQPLIYPESESRQPPGYDPAHDRRPPFRSEIQRTIRSRKPALSTPYTVRPEGWAVTAMQALYRKEAFWGLSFVVLDLSPILAEAGLDPSPSGLEVALQDRSDRLFYGKQGVLEGNPVLSKIDLPDGAWKLAAIPVGGWSAAIAVPLLQFRTMTLALVLLLTALMGLMAGSGSRLRLAVRRRTEELQRSLANHREDEEHLTKAIENLRRTMRATLDALAIAVETKDPCMSGHHRRVADLARTIAMEMGLPEETIEGIRTAAAIHDIGKINLPAEIVGKPARLTEGEFSLIKTHSQTGYDILKDVAFSWPVGRMVWQHHERMDGSGYPLGLTGENIMMEARVLAVADVVEAMASARSYRPTPGLDKALEEILKQREILYDPAVVDACIRIFKEKDFRLA